MTDIVERLRSGREWICNDPNIGFPVKDNAPFEAADELERLKADLKQAESNGIEFELQRDKALATIDRLRSALAEIAAHDDQFSSPQQARTMRDAARRALEPKL